MQLPGHSVWICGNLHKELDEREKNLVKESKKGSWVILWGKLVPLPMANLWLYRGLHSSTLVAKERKEGAKESKKVGSNNNNETKDHLDVLSMVTGIG